MDLGNFSISLAVRDIEASRTFYERLGFERTLGGDNWGIFINGKAVIGLFQGMFEDNLITFNESDVRGIAASLREQGVEVEVMTMPDPTDPSRLEPAGPEGPGHFTLTDPDGNHLLFDQS